MDWGTLFLLIPSTLFFLGTVALVLWPMFSAAVEISKAIRSHVTEPKRFTLTKDGATIWNTSSRSANKSLSVGDERLRLSVLATCALEAAFIVFLTVFLFQHSNPHDAFMLIFLPLTLPAFILAKHGKWLVLAAGLAALAAVAYFALWLELVSEMGLPK